MTDASIYVLKDAATNEIRYVGYTVKTLKDRLDRHFYIADHYPENVTHRAQWLRSRRRWVVIELVEIVAAEYVDFAERRWIAALREAGCDLVNTTDGGGGRLGLKRSDAERAKHRATIAARGPLPLNLDAIEKSRIKQTGTKRTDETRAKMSARKKGRPWTDAQRASLAKARPRQPEKPIEDSRTCDRCGRGPFRGARGIYRHLEHFHNIFQTGGTYQ